MRWLKILLVVAGTMILASADARASSVKIIANLNVKADTVSAEEIKSVFLQQTMSLGDGTHVEPVLERGGPTHEAFLKEYLDRNDNNLQTYYRALVFTGRGSMPKQFRSDIEIVSYVARTRGAIGYVSNESSTYGVKTLAIVHGRGDVERTLISTVEPEYPETLQRLHIGGTVRLHVTIAAKGNVEQVELLGGNPILAESAIAAVKRWVYSVARSRSTTDVTIPFDPHP